MLHRLAGNERHRHEHADDLQGLDGRRDQSALRGVQPEDVLVDQRQEVRDREQRNAEERHREPDAPNRPYATEHPHRRPHGLVRVGQRRGLVVGARGDAVVVAAHGLAQPKREEDEDEGRDRKDHERRAPTEEVRDHTCEHRTEDLSDAVRLPMDREDLGSRSR